MSEIDGYYRYAGTEVRLDPRGIRLKHAGRPSRIVHVGWRRVTGAHLAGLAEEFVQIDVAGRDAADQPASDDFAFPVRSQHDAQRFLTQISWYAERGDQPHATDTAGVPAGGRRRPWRGRLLGQRRGR